MIDIKDEAENASSVSGAQYRLETNESNLLDSIDKNQDCRQILSPNMAKQLSAESNKMTDITPVALA